MLILAFDTTMAACSVAVWRDGKTLAAESQVMEQGQAEALMPMIERVLAESGSSYDALDQVAVTVGPGSFTGVRVGIAAARGIGLAASKPVIGFTTTEVLAVSAQEQNIRILAAIDTKRGDLYVQMFDAERRCMGAPCVVSIQELGAWAGVQPVCVIGDGADAAAGAIGPHAVLSSKGPLPDVNALAQIASMKPGAGADVAPVYARAPDAALPAGGGRLRP